LREKKIKIQSYTDQYSARDENLNESLAELNRLLGKKNMDRVAINKRIDDYIEDYHKKQLSKREALKKNILKNTEPKILRANYATQQKSVVNQINFDIQVEDPTADVNIKLEPKIKKVEIKLSQLQQIEKKQREFALFNDFKKSVTEKEKILIKNNNYSTDNINIEKNENHESFEENVNNEFQLNKEKKKDYIENDSASKFLFLY